MQTTTRSFNSGGEYVYAGTAAQSTGTGLPGTVSKLTINNAAGVTLSQSTSVSGTLNMATPSTDTSVGSGVLTLGSGTTLTVASGGTATFGAYPRLAGAGNFTLASGASVKTANANGLANGTSSGSVRISGTRSLTTGANYTYNGTVAQTIGNNVPGTVANLTIDNAAGVTMTNPFAVSGTATFSSGSLASGTRTLTISNGGTAVFGASSVFTGAGTFTLSNGATLKTAHTGGLGYPGTATGSVQSTNATFDSGASYVYNGTAAQVTGAILSGSCKNFTVDNAAGVTTSAGFTVTGTATFGNGNLTVPSGTFQCTGTAVFGATPIMTGNGTGRFTGILKTANLNGISSSGSMGSVQTGTRIFGTTASYVYNGAAAQSTGTGLPAPVSNLTVDNVAGVTLTSPTTVTNALTMTNGVLTTSSNTVTLNASTGSISESETSYVTGTVQQTQNLSADGTTYNFGNMGLQLTPSGATLPGSTLAVRKTGTAATNVNGSTGILRYFTITPTVNTGLDVTLEMGYRDGELNGLSEGTMSVYKATSSPSGPWVAQPSANTTRDAIANTVTQTGLTDFSVWTLGVEGPLPVELTAFTAEREGDAARLRWRTASEKNSAAFEVERSHDGKAFERIGTVAAQGNSSRPQRLHLSG